MLGKPGKRLLPVLALLFLAAPFAAFAQGAPAPDSGDTAWMLTATALVLFMTIPGLSLFYGGLVRKKNILSILMQCFAATAMMTVLWVLYGYSVAFDTTGMKEGTTNLNSFIGGFSRVFLKGLSKESLVLTIPESIFVVFQMTFAIITPALFIGAFAERMKFSAVLLFMAGWFTLSYLPICHMAWSGGGALFWDWGVLDFAGGTVVHINAAAAALVACIVVGRRTGFGSEAMPPHNLPLTIAGAGMLWVGWFGFNAGSAVSAGQDAGMAMLVTQVATAMAALAWSAVEWLKHGKPSTLGIVSGAVAGLVAITPASGTVGPMGALVIGLVAGVLCQVASTTVKRALGYDDSLDVVGVHGMGGIVGCILTGVFASTSLGGFKELESIPGQVWTQALSAGVTLLWSGVVSFVLLKVINAVVGLRVEAPKESEGLDIADHNETAYNMY